MFANSVSHINEREVNLIYLIETYAIAFFIDKKGIGNLFFIIAN